MITWLQWVTMQNVSDHELQPAKPGPHRWQKGQPSPNPKGRPRSGLAFAERVRERIDPDLVIDLALRVAADETISPERRLEALLPLIDRGFIKPPTTIAARVETTDMTPRRDWHAVPVGDRRALLEQIRRVRDPKVLDGGVALLPAPVALALASTDDE